jgi:tetratricopeptide (TPR) repeat protein
MTEHSTLLTSLKSIFPESSWAWAIPALRHDPMVWNSLKDQDFFSQVCAASSEPRDWSPYQLALIALGIEDIETLSEELQSDSQAALSQFLDRGSPSNEQLGDIGHASLIALAMYQCLQSDDWQDIAGALQNSPVENNGWLAPTAILLGWVPDKLQFINRLINQENDFILNLVVHVVLSQPLPPEETQHLFWGAIEPLRLVQVVTLLDSLNGHRPELTMLLANEWLQANPITSNGEPFSGIGSQLQQVTSNLLSAQLLTMAGQREKAEQRKVHSLQSLIDLQIEVSNQLVGESLLDKNIEYALSQWTRTTASPKLTPPAGLVVELLRAGRIDDSLTLLPDTDGNTQTPLRWLNNIYQALENDDVAQARLFAHQTLNSFCDIFEQGPSSAEKVFGSRRDMLKFISEMINQLADLALYKESFRAAQIASSISPDDPQALMTVAKSARSAGEHAEAVAAAELAVALQPTQPEYRRQLARSLEAAGDWRTALPERQVILEHRFAQTAAPTWPTSADLLAYANCAIHAGKPGEAYEVCQKAIDLDPADGHAHAILGEALSAQGKDEQAMEHFSLATQLAPHKAAPWLSLAQAYQRTGQTDKTIETLRTASHAVPEDPAIFFALGNVHITEDSPSQAQSAMERAYQLVSQPRAFRSQNKSSKSGISQAELFSRNREQLCEIALAYGDILEQLGHQEQANQVFENAYQAYPAYPGLAYIYAKSILSHGEESAALAPLAIAVSANPPEPQPYIEYARALLHANENPQDAVQALEKALELLEKQYHESDPDGEQIQYLATALLAQAQEAAGELVPALQTYTLALETPIADQDQWRSRLAIGLGRVAIQLDQPEIAIAALQDPNQKEIQHTEVAQILCEAYTAISLIQEAIFAARSAVHLAPDDVDILAWFAERAIELGVIAESIPALKSAVQLDSQRTDLIIHLAQVEARMGKDDAAREAFLSALSSPYSTPENLYQAADGLSDLGDNEAAADCLERALELQPQPPLDLITELSNAYAAAGKTELAIKTIDKGIDQYSEDALLHAYKADLLGKLGRHQAARACLEHALIVEPDNPTVHLQIAFVLRDQDEVYPAFDHAMQAVKGLTASTGQQAALGLAAELARSTLQEDQTRQLLESGLTLDEPASSEQQPSTLHSPFDYYCIQAESSLELEEQIAAASALNEAFNLKAEHPRLLALQTRMAIRQGDRENAQSSFESLIAKIEAADQESVSNELPSNTLLGSALAAIELYKWDQAVEILDKAAALYPNDSNLHLQKARLFVLRAEFQRLCQALEIINHAPGGSALSPRTFRIFEETIQATIESLSQDMQADLPPAIERWRTRGSVAFQPSVDALHSLEKLPKQPSDQAALIAALTQNGDAGQVARLYHAIQSQADAETLHHAIYAAYALALSAIGQDQISLEQAREAIAAAIDQNPADAIYHVIQAKVAEQLGDWHIALGAIQTALSLWSDEARWQSYLAQLLLLSDQYPEAVVHYLSAIEMEPKHVQHYLDLSQAYLRNGEPEQAISILKEATKIAPDQASPYLALASAYYEHQNYIQAKRTADLSIKIAPDQLAPLLLCAKIALKLDDPGQAKAKTESALRLNPDDSQALYLQAQAYSALGDNERALKVVEKAISLSSDPLPLYLQRADLLAKFDGPQELLSELISIAEQYPDEPLVLAPLAKAYAEAGQNSEAIQAAQQALHRGKGQLPLDEQAQLHHLLGCLLRQSGQLDQSIHQLSEAIRIAPQDLSSYLELGLTQEERRQHGPAMETYKKAIKTYPSDPRPYYQAGLLLKSSRDYSAAESMLRKAAEKAPDDIDIHRQLAALVALNLVHNRQPVSTEI